jgi:hypothetical protein
MATLTNWKPYTQKVDNSSALGEGRFAAGTFTMVAAGPPRLSSVGGVAAASANLSGQGGLNWALPIGVVQNFNLAHNKQFARFWELGSERSYFIAGRTTAQAGFSRVLYNGPSLLRMMYAFYQDLLAPTTIRSFGVDATIPLSVANQHDVKIPPGFENIFLNLASDLFSQPCGLLVYMKDSNETTLAACYLEETYVPSHSIATDAQGVVMQEQVALQPERVVPIAVSSLALVESGIDTALAAAAGA